MIVRNYRDVIKRVAIALIVVGTVDFLYLLFWLSKGISYVSNFNLFAVVLGAILLKKQDLEFAEKVSFHYGFFFGGVLCASVAIPFSHPITYWQDKILSDLFWVLVGFIQIIFFLGFSAWIFLQLTSLPIIQQRQSLGLRRDRSMWGLGAGVVLGMVIFIHIVFFSA